jgi:hypothetical protein
MGQVSTVQEAQVPIQCKQQASDASRMHKGIADGPLLLQHRK